MAQSTPLICGCVRARVHVSEEHLLSASPSPFSHVFAMSADTDVQDSKNLAAAVSTFNQTVGPRAFSVGLSDSDDSIIRVIFKDGIWHTEIEGHGRFTAEAFPLPDTDDAEVEAAATDAAAAAAETAAAATRADTVATAAAAAATEPVPAPDDG